MSSIPVTDGYESSAIVRGAVEALSAFGGDGLSHGEAARLLSMWAHVGELTAREKVAVLARFPRLCGDAEAGYRLAAGTGEYADEPTDEPLPELPVSFGDLKPGAVFLPMEDDSNSGPGWPTGR